jgi:hypothetical protein
VSRLRRVLLVCSLGLPAIAAGQQQARAGARSVMVGVTARLVVGVRVDARQTGPAEVTTAVNGSSEVIIPVSAAANLAWRLSLSLGGGTRHGLVEALDAAGRWTPLPNAQGAPLLVVGEGERTNPLAVSVRLRLSDPRDLPLVERATLRMEPKEAGAP